MWLTGGRKREEVEGAGPETHRPLTQRQYEEGAGDQGAQVAELGTEVSRTGRSRRSSFCSPNGRRVEERIAALRAQQQHAGHEEQERQDN